MLLVQYREADDDCVSQRKKAGKGKGRLRVTAPDRKRPKGSKGYNWRRSICIRRYLAQFCNVITSGMLVKSPYAFYGWCRYLVQKEKQIRIQSGSAFPSTNYAMAGSGRLMLPRINIRRNVPLAADIQIIRPPLHHLHPRFQMLGLMHIRRPHAVALLVAHLALDGVL